MILTTPQKAALLKTSCNLNIISDFSQSFKVFEVLNINIVDNGILRLREAMTCKIVGEGFAPPGGKPVFSRLRPANPHDVLHTAREGQAPPLQV